MLNLMCNCKELLHIRSQESLQSDLKFFMNCPADDVRRAFYDWYITKCTYKRHWTDQELWTDFYMIKVHEKTWREGAKEWVSSKDNKK